jgi:glucose-1-phosphate thymidylyltransferase
MVEKAIVVAQEATALLPVANRPLISHSVTELARSGVRHVAVVTPPQLHSAVEGSLQPGRFDRVQLEYFEHDPKAGLYDALTELESFVGRDPFVVHLGDSLGRDCLETLMQVPPHELDSTVLVRRGVPDERVVRLAPRQQASWEGEDAEAAGIWALGPNALQVAKDVAPSGDAEVDINATIARLADLGGQVSVRPVGEWWRFAERPEALLEANRFALEAMRGEPVEAELRDTQIQGPVVVDATARLDASVVRGPVMIAAGARITDAYIGPYTSIGPNVVVEGTEIENSVVLGGASVCHLGGRLEGSVVGPNARVFRDFRLPRAVRLNVGEGAEISLA